MRHPDWDKCITYFGMIQDNIGSVVRDLRCNMIWDAGQAICAEAYGEDWMRHPIFVEWNKKDDTEPPEPHYFETAKKMARGYIPDWIDKEAGK